MTRWAVLLLMALSQPALAIHHKGMPDHWYDGDCCSQHDCRPAKLGEIRFTERGGEVGWLVTTERLTQWIPEFENGVRNRRVRVSRDEYNHLCIPESRGRADDLSVQCIYISRIRT